jgi:hypothetical protein
MRWEDADKGNAVMSAIWTLEFGDRKRLLAVTAVCRTEKGEECRIRADLKKSAVAGGPTRRDEVEAEECDVTEKNFHVASL